MRLFFPVFNQNIIILINFETVPPKCTIKTIKFTHPQKRKQAHKHLFLSSFLLYTDKQASNWRIHICKWRIHICKSFRYIISSQLEPPHTGGQGSWVSGLRGRVGGEESKSMPFLLNYKPLVHYIVIMLRNIGVAIV